MPVKTGTGLAPPAAALIAVALLGRLRGRPVWRILRLVSVTALTALLALMIWHPFAPRVHRGELEMTVIDGIKTFIKQELPPLEPGAMSYMMSKEQYLTDDDHHNWMAHLMFYTPLMDGAVWGADLPHSPVMLNPQFRGAPEPINVFMVPAGWWSDGTADSVR